MTRIVTWKNTLLLFCVYLLVLSPASSRIFETRPTGQSIECKMKYVWFGKICANWSATSRKSHLSKPYAVVYDFTEYSSTIEKFIEDYPYVKIATYGRAISELTFGDVGREGDLTFETILFNHKDFHNEYIVTAYLNAFSFDVGVEIGVGFKFDGNTLYLRPFTNGWMYSVGIPRRCLRFGLGVDSITFHPKSEKIKFDQIRHLYNVTVL